MLLCYRSFFAILCAFVFVMPLSVYAQDEVLPGALVLGNVGAESQDGYLDDQSLTDDPIIEGSSATEVPYLRTSSLSVGEERFNLGSIPSTMLTYWEQAAIIEALNAQGFARPTTYNEMIDGDEFVPDRPKPPPEERYLTLGGIVYASSKDWTVWLNGKRVTPEALPPEAIDLIVKKNYIEIKWYDEYTNQIFPVRLRPHQRFNIDTRIFLPG